MSERPPGSGAPEEGTPEYDWLYGTDTAKGHASDPDSTRVIPRPGRDQQPTQQRPVPSDQAGAAPPGPAQGQPAADRTQVMPVTPSASQQRPSSGSNRPTPPAAAAPVGPPTQRGGRRFGLALRRPRFRLRYLWLLLLLWIAYLVFVPLYAWHSVSKVDHGFPQGNRPADQPGTNYLIIGSDKADDLSQAQQKALKTGPRGGTNTDTIIVLHVGSGLTTMMSIPRDTLTEVPGHGTEMVNAAFSQGRYPLLIATVEKLTGIHIDHFVELGFGSVINTVDALGGITICPPVDMKDPMARLNVKKGCQTVNGETALAYSRSRHIKSVQPLSDLNRVGQQREVISAIGDKVVSPWTILNPFRYWSFNMAAAHSVRVDSEMGIFDAERFARAMAGKHQTCTMPNLPSTVNANRIAVDPSRAKPLFSAIIHDSAIPAADCTATGRTK